MNEKKSSAGKMILIFLAKTFIFTVIFWVASFFLIKPILLPNFNKSEVSSEKNRNEIYDQQVRKVDDQLAVISEQQKRMDALLSRYEKQAVRYDNILNKWENAKENSK